MTLKQSALVVILFVISSLQHFTAEATSPDATIKKTTSTTTTSSADDYICNLYAQIDFGKGQRLDEAIFQKAMTGYLNLKNAGLLSNTHQILTVADFTQSSTKNRLWVIDLKAKKVLYNTYVAHGQGSGEEFATSFSNQDGTHQSSLGFYITGDTYNGEHGNSLRLNGMDQGYNSAAFNRGIVMHSADYVCKDLIASQGRLGRSWGCPALAPDLAQPIINLIKNGTCLFIYYPQKEYLKTSVWINTKVQNLSTADASEPFAPKKG